MVRCHLQDMKPSESLDFSGLRYDLVFGSSKEIRTWRITEVKVVDNSCRHGRQIRWRPSPRRAGEDPYALCMPPNIDTSLNPASVTQLNVLSAGGLLYLRL
jgi:hypothetical protein